MKKIITLISVLLLMLVVTIFSSCKQLELSDQEAQTLVINVLKLPQAFHQDVTGTDGTNNASTILEQQGYLTKSGSWLYGYSLYATALGKPYVVGTGNDALYGTSTLSFKTFDIGFNEITGIAVDKDQQTATVRFSIKAINVTPVGRLLEQNVDAARIGELIFKKFDNGWQLQSNQNISGVSLVKKIFWPNSN